MSYQKLAFMIGLLGSMHCLGMCGPLAFAVPVLQKGWAWLFLNKVAYQLGRIISYCVLGMLTGLLGRQIWLIGLQQGVTMVTGLLIIFAACSRLFRFPVNKAKTFISKPFYRLFDYAFKQKANHLIIGIINGLLPCGFVYMALAGALNTGGVGSAVVYMFWYGLGTLPLMLIAGIGMGFSTAALRKYINRVVPYMMICLGLWFVLRGAELNIPYLSHAKADGVANCK
jgi:sulfite exporter TauE/SafE